MCYYVDWETAHLDCISYFKTSIKLVEKGKGKPHRGLRDRLQALRACNNPRELAVAWNKATDAIEKDFSPIESASIGFHGSNLRMIRDNKYYLTYFFIADRDGNRVDIMDVWNQGEEE